MNNGSDEQKKKMMMAMSDDECNRLQCNLQFLMQSAAMCVRGEWLHACDAVVVGGNLSVINSA